MKVILAKMMQKNLLIEMVLLKNGTKVPLKITILGRLFRTVSRIKKEWFFSLQKPSRMELQILLISFITSI